MIEAQVNIHIYIYWEFSNLNDTNILTVYYPQKNFCFRIIEKGQEEWCYAEMKIISKIVS